MKLEMGRVRLRTSATSIGYGAHGALAGRTQACKPVPFRRLGIMTAGFTLIELLVVLAIVSLLLTLTVPRYFQSIDTAKETILAENLRATRETIDKFYGDTGRYPESLDELVEKKYLRGLPFDPVTDSAATWIIVAPDATAKGGIYDIKSGAAGKAKNGKPYAEL